MLVFRGSPEEKRENSPRAQNDRQPGTVGPLIKSGSEGPNPQNSLGPAKNKKNDATKDYMDEEISSNIRNKAIDLFLECFTHFEVSVTKEELLELIKEFFKEPKNEIVEKILAICTPKREDYVGFLALDNLRLLAAFKILDSFYMILMEVIEDENMECSQYEHLKAFFPKLSNYRWYIMKTLRAESN